MANRHARLRERGVQLTVLVSIIFTKAPFPWTAASFINVKLNNLLTSYLQCRGEKSILLIGFINVGGINLFLGNTREN